MLMAIKLYDIRVKRNVFLADGCPGAREEERERSVRSCGFYMIFCRNRIL